MSVTPTLSALTSAALNHDTCVWWQILTSFYRLTVSWYVARMHSRPLLCSAASLHFLRMARRWRVVLLDAIIAEDKNSRWFPLALCANISQVLIEIGYMARWESEHERMGFRSYRTREKHCVKEILLRLLYFFIEVNWVRLETTKLHFVIRYRLLFHCGFLQCINNNFTKAHSKCYS